MKMTLDEAIKHAKKMVKRNERDAVIYSNCKNNKKNLVEIELAENAEKKCRKCAGEYRQLAEWLRELKRYREHGMVSKAVFEQIQWERDTAIQQLKELGYGLGEKITQESKL